MELPPKPKPGTPIRAEWGRKMWEYVASLRIVTGPGSGLGSEITPAGTRIWKVKDQELWIRITARSGDEYAWNAVRATPGGTWADLPAPAGTLGPSVDAAREEAGAVAGVPQVVRAVREPHSRRLFFARDTCS